MGRIGDHSLKADILPNSITVYFDITFKYRNIFNVILYYFCICT